MSAFLKAVFNWTIENTTDYGSEPPEVDEAKMEWLRKAWDSFVVDGATLMKRALAMLENGMTDDQVLVLDNLTELLEDIDNAAVLRSLNGLQTVFRLSQSSPSLEVRQAAIRSLIAVFHNNDRGVRDGLDEGLIQVLDNLLKEASAAHTEKQLASLLGVLLQSPLFISEYFAKAPGGPKNLIALYKDLDPASPRVAHVLSTLRERIVLEPDSIYKDCISTWINEE